MRYHCNNEPEGFVRQRRSAIIEQFKSVRCVPEGSLGGIKRSTRTLEKYKEFENVFQCICGLCNIGVGENF